MQKGRINAAAELMAGRRADKMRPFIADDGNAYAVNFKGGDAKDPANYEAVPVNNATLRYDEWRMLDDAVVRIAEERLVGFDDLRANGLTYPLANAMGTTVLTWEKMSDALAAEISMDPVKKGQNDQADYSAAHTPIPIIHADYTLGERVLQESRNRGNGIDVLNAERAARRVSEKLEDMLFGSTAALAYGGGTIHTYLTHPDRNQGSLTANWDTVGASAGMTPEDIVEDVLAMKQDMIDANYFGPKVLYIPSNYDTVMDKDYNVSGASTMTIRQRIEAIEGITKVQVVDRLASNTVIMVCMTRDVVDLIDGMPFQNVQWSTEGGFVHNYKVMTIQVPRIKSDYDGNSGIVVYT